jgi:hypothetical protein
MLLVYGLKSRNTEQKAWNEAVLGQNGGTEAKNYTSQGSKTIITPLPQYF